MKLLHGELQEATSEITQLCNKVEELKQQSSIDYQNSSYAQELNKLQQEQTKLQKLLEEEKESRTLVRICMASLALCICTFMLLMIFVCMCCMMGVHYQSTFISQSKSISE